MAVRGFVLDKKQRSKKELSHTILREHYFRLAKTWATRFSLVVLLAFTFAPFSAANAAQLSSRKAVLSDSGAGDAGVAIDHFDTVTTASTLVKGIRYQFCTSPLYNTACTLPTGLVRGTTISTQLYNGSAMGNAYTAATSGTTDVLLSNATGNTMVSGKVLEIKLSGFTNPTTANQEFYIRTEICATTACTVPTDVVDEGSVAVSTTQVLSVTANVQEDLTFCVGTSITGNCTTATGSTVTLAPNPMGVSAPSVGTAKMAASTNGTSGYAISYNATAFTDTTSDTICTGTCATGMTTGQALNAGGTEQFGFNLAANSGGAFGTTLGPSGGIGNFVSPYGTNNTIAYTVGSATSLASATGPTAQTTYTMSFGANIAGTTKPGAYTATQTFIATASF